MTNTRPQSTSENKGDPQGLTVRGCSLQGLGEQEELPAEGPGQGHFQARHAQLCRLHTAAPTASPPLPHIHVFLQLAQEVL